MYKSLSAKQMDLSLPVLSLLDLMVLEVFYNLIESMIL